MYHLLVKSAKFIFLVSTQLHFFQTNSFLPLTKNHTSTLDKYPPYQNTPSPSFKTVNTL